jgi:hypothetical protein
VRPVENVQWLTQTDGRGGGGGESLFPVSAWEGGEGRFNGEGVGAEQALGCSLRTKKRKEAAMHHGRRCPACKQHTYGKQHRCRVLRAACCVHGSVRLTSGVETSTYTWTIDRDCEPS